MLGLVYAATNMLYYLNNAVNFALYCISGTRFRKALVELMRCERARDRRASEYSRQMSRSTQFTRLSRVSQDITMATDSKDGVLKRKKIDNGLESVPEAEV